MEGGKASQGKIKEGVLVDRVQGQKLPVSGPEEGSQKEKDPYDPVFYQKPDQGCQKDQEDQLLKVPEYGIVKVVDHCPIQGDPVKGHVARLPGKGSQTAGYHKAAHIVKQVPEEVGQQHRKGPALPFLQHKGPGEMLRGFSEKEICAYHKKARHRRLSQAVCKEVLHPPCKGGEALSLGRQGHINRMHPDNQYRECKGKDRYSVSQALFLHLYSSRRLLIRSTGLRSRSRESSWFRQSIRRATYFAMSTLTYHSRSRSSLG